jgi:hypothetical protein
MAGVPVVVSTDFDSDCINTLRENELFSATEIIEITGPPLQGVV